MNPLTRLISRLLAALSRLDYRRRVRQHQRQQQELRDQAAASIAEQLRRRDREQ